VQNAKGKMQNDECGMMNDEQKNGIEMQRAECKARNAKRRMMNAE